MPTLEEYCAWTEQNISRARVAQTDAERLFYLDLARTYPSEVVRLDSAKLCRLPRCFRWGCKVFQTTKVQIEIPTIPIQMTVEAVRVGHGGDMFRHVALGCLPV